MPATIGEVRGSQLPKEWSQFISVNPEEKYTITIQSQEDRRTSVQRLQAIMDQISEEAEKNGMTAEDLEEILGKEI